MMQLWVATRGGRDVGRIAGIIDHNHNRVTKDPAAFFGFFESVDDAGGEPAVVRDGRRLGAPGGACSACWGR